VAKKDLDDKEAQAAVEAELEKEAAKSEKEAALPSEKELEKDELRSK